MTFASRIAAAALGFAAPALLIATPALSQALPAAVGKPLTAAQRAAAAGNTGAAVANINTARAAASNSAERNAVARMAGYVYTRAGQFGRAAQELESVGAPASQLAPLYYRANNCPKAITLAKRAGLQTVIAQCQLKQGDFKSAVGTYKKLVAQSPNNEGYLQNLAGAQYKAGDKAGYLATTEKLVRLDPSPARWNALLLNLKQEKMSRESKLALFQLMRETNNIKRPEDYQEFAKLAIVSNQPGVAKRALDEARAANVIAPSDQMTVGLINAATERTAQAQASIGKLPKTPAGRFQAGGTYFGAGNYAAAAQAFGAAAAGGSNVDQARLFQGISQVRAGQAGAGRTTLRGVPAGSPVKDVADLWALYASTRA